MKLLYSILDSVLNSEVADKVAGIGGGVVASTITFISTGFGGFMLKCVAAAIFALIGGLMGYAGKKLGEHIFNHYKKRKATKK